MDLNQKRIFTLHKTFTFDFLECEIILNRTDDGYCDIFILGSAICGIAGAMMTTLDSQLTPGTYQPLRYTFLIWVMVIIGGSGNNLGAVLGGFIIWFLWVQVEPIGQFLMVILTSGLAEDNSLKLHLMDSVAHMRLLTMGLLLLLVLRFSPRGLIPEK